MPLAELEPFRVPLPPQEPEPLPYLRGEPWAYDLALEVELNGDVVSRTSARHLYWSVEQQIAHLTANGASLRTGDLLATGTISGPEPGRAGSLIELTWNGAEPLALADGSRRTFLEDGDEVVLRAPQLELEVRGRIEPVAVTSAAAVQRVSGTHRRDPELVGRGARGRAQRVRRADRPAPAAGGRARTAAAPRPARGGGRRPGGAAPDVPSARGAPRAGAVRRWLCGIAANLARMRLRAAARGLVSLEELEGGGGCRQACCGARSGPEQVGRGARALRLVRAAVDVLPDGSATSSCCTTSTGSRARRSRRCSVARRARSASGCIARGASSATRSASFPSRHHACGRATAEGADGNDRGHAARTSSSGSARRATSPVAHPARIVLLRERGGERVVRSGSARPRATRLALHRGGAATRGRSPLELTFRLLEAAGGRSSESSLEPARDIFYAVAELRVGDASHEVDARPSDALDLAVRAGATILVADDDSRRRASPRQTSCRLDEERARRARRGRAGGWRSLSPSS